MSRTKTGRIYLNEKQSSHFSNDIYTREGYQYMNHFKLERGLYIQVENMPTNKLDISQTEIGNCLFKLCCKHSDVNT